MSRYILALIPCLALGQVSNTDQWKARCDMYLGRVTADGEYSAQLLPGSPLLQECGWDVAKLGKAWPDEAALMAATGGATVQESGAIATAWVAARKLPTPMEPIAIRGDDGHYYKPVPYDGTWLAAQVSDSPLTNAARAAQGEADAKAAHDKATKDVLRELRLLKGSIETNKASVQAINTTLTTAAAQQAQISALRKALIDVISDQQAARKLDTRALRGDDQ